LKKKKREHNREEIKRRTQNAQREGQTEEKRSVPLFSSEGENATAAKERAGNGRI